MQLLPALDNVLYNIQRQGKISFYVSTNVTSFVVYYMQTPQMTSVRPWSHLAYTVKPDSSCSTVKRPQ